VRFPASAAAIVAAVTAATVAAAPRPVVQAVWLAQAGAAMFHGNVSAQALPTSGNAIVGSWTLTNDDGAVTMRGTWSGKKSARGWTGTWQAKVAPGGGNFAGTWQAVPPAGFPGKTFEDLFLAVGTVQISGYWKARGGATGAWWLKPPPSPGD
jgi:hypothetical protein